MVDAIIAMVLVCERSRLDKVGEFAKEKARKSGRMSWKVDGANSSTSARHYWKQSKERARNEDTRLDQINTMLYIQQSR